MQIIQIADLHISQTTDSRLAKKKIDRLFASIEQELSKSEEIILCLLGDIVDKGDAGSYSAATKVITYLIKKFENFDNFSIECVPGNHDLCGCPHKVKPKPCTSKECSLESFDSFCVSIGANNNPDDSICVRNYNAINLIKASSVYVNDCSFGAIDCEKLNEIDSAKPALILTHHTFLSDNSGDSSVIRNGYEFFKELETKNIIGILHGHTHGYKNITIEEKCRIIGVGPFLKEVQDINNQFNLISIDATGIAKIVNFAYRADNDSYSGKIVFTRKNDGIYIGSDVSSVYRLIVNDIKVIGSISNLVIKLSMPINSFYSQIETMFPDHISVAENWQNDEVPEDLYYNHGSYMKVGDKKGIDFVIEELTAKATSSRALIPLISLKTVMESGDDFLPSFDIVQFGFDDDSKMKLTVTLYMRALEVNHFLRINFSELYVLIKRIQDKLRSIKDVGVNIVAFRAQYKENFGCFAKARLDTTSESELYAYIDENNASEVANLLEEKIKFSETVVRDEGIENLHKALRTLHRKGKIDESLMECMEKVCKAMSRLKEEGKKTSNYSEIDETENTVHSAIRTLITQLNERNCS